MESIWTKQYINSIKQIVRQTLRSKLGDYRDSGDIEQDAIMRIYAKRNKIPAGIKHDNYIRGMVRNFAYDVLRRKYNLTNLYYEIPLYSPREDGDPYWSVEEHAISYSKEISDPFVVQALSKAISKLSPEHQKVLLLRAQGVEYKDIAKVLNIPVGTVRSRLHHAKKICAKHVPNLN